MAGFTERGTGTRGRPTTPHSVKRSWNAFRERQYGIRSLWSRPLCVCGLCSQPGVDWEVGLLKFGRALKPRFLEKGSGCWAGA